MLIRVGTCTNCDATFQLPADFESPWVRCRICGGAVAVAEPSDPAEIGKRGRRGRSGASGKGLDKGAAGAAATAAAATLTKSVADKSAEAGQRLEDAGEATRAVLDEMDLDLEEMELIEDALDGPPEAPAIPARAVADDAPKSAGKWSPAELERQAKAKAKEAADQAQAEREAAEAAREQEAAKARAAQEQAAKARAEREAAAERERAAAAKSAEPELVEVTRPKKKSGMSTLERLKAERAAADGTAGSAKPAAKGGTLERLKAERAAAAAAATGAVAAAGAARSDRPAETEASDERPATRSSSRRSSRGSSGRGSKSRGAGARSSRRGGQDEESEEAASGTSRRRSSSRGSKDRSPRNGLIGIGALVALAGVMGFGFKQGWFEGPVIEQPAAEDSADDQVAAADKEPIADPFAAAGIDDSAADAEPGAETDAESGAEPGDAAQPSDADAPEDGEPVADADEPEDVAAAEPESDLVPGVDIPLPGRDPASIDLEGLADFEPLEGTDPEVWSEAVRLSAKILDPGTTRGLNKAQADLIALGRPAFPAILNELKRVDLSELSGAAAAQTGIDALKKIANGNGYSWKQSAEVDAQYLNRKAVSLYFKKWEEIGADDAAWAKFAKLDPETMEPLSAEDRNAPPSDS